MSMGRSTGVIVMLLAFMLAIGVSADTVTVRNKFENNKAVITVACYANVDWSSEDYVKPGEEVAVTVPFNEGVFGGRPSYCTGFWKYAGQPGHVKIYRSFLNHEACKDKCVVEVRDNGSFLWNQTEKAWDLIDKLPHYNENALGLDCIRTGTSTGRVRGEGLTILTATKWINEAGLSNIRVNW